MLSRCSLCFPIVRLLPRDNLTPPSNINKYDAVDFSLAYSGSSCSDGVFDLQEGCQWFVSLPESLDLADFSARQN